MAKRKLKGLYDGMGYVARKKCNTFEDKKTHKVCQPGRLTKVRFHREQGDRKGTPLRVILHIASG